MSQTATVMDFGARIAWWARMAWPGSRAKNLANLLGISESQAKRILAGALPTSEQIAVMAQAWGWRFVHYTFEGLAGPIPPIRAMRAEMDGMDARVARLEKEMRIEDARGNAIAMAAVEVARPGAIALSADSGVGGADATKIAPVAPERDHP